MFLTGFMATGKSRIGRALAQRTGRSFLDTDAMIETRAGKSIPEIFAADGEAAFRSLETACVREAAATAGAVVALGGGAITRVENRQAIRDAGALLVCVEADVDTILERVSRRDDRPLLSGLSRAEKRRRIADMLAERAPHYATADWTVRSTPDTDADGLAAELAARLEATTPLNPIRIATPDGGGYDVVVGHGILDELGERCAGLGLGRRCALIADAALSDTLALRAADSLRAAGVEVLSLPYGAGEEGKNLASLESLIGHMLEAGFDRGAWVVALGGGVVGDLAGFVAASFLRGIDVVQVPTTIVAQVDASMGGKTAVNHRLGKNLIGAFHPPRLVLTDTDALRSLPPAEVAAGLGEVVKHGVIRDAELFAFLEDRIEDAAAMRLSADELDWLIARNAQIKADVVSADEREGGLRAILNYGHTVGHAIEAATRYERYRHGEAVALGMIAASELGARLGMWEGDARARHDALVQRLGIPSGVGAVDTDEIVARTKADKKRRDGQHRFILARRIGQVEIVDGVEDAQVRAAVEALQARYP